MKATELRLGNWVEQPNDGVTRVTAVLNDLQIKTETGYVDKYCRPIPLTEEWLLKFGFVLRGLYYHFPNYDIFKIEQYKLKNAYWLRHRTESLDCARINYVHQLQNLYFALTGKELELT